MGLQIRRGTDAQRLTTVFAEGEPVFTTDTEKLYVGDGVTIGGILASPEQLVGPLDSVEFYDITIDNIATINTLVFAADTGTSITSRSELIGPMGYTGSQGFTGSQGEQGIQGYTGSAGIQGYTGSQGNTGFTGSIGDIGATGYTGSAGDIGATGYTGSIGDTGYTGSQGDIGYTGSRGGNVGRQYFFNYSVTEVGSYKELGIEPTTATQTTLTTSCVGNTSTLLASFASDPFEFALIPGGAQDFKLHMSKAGNGNDVDGYCVLKLAANDGTVISTIGQTGYTAIGWNTDANTPVEVITDIVLPTTAVEIGQRMIVEIYARNNDGNTRNIKFYTEGAAYYSFVTTSLQAAPGPTGYTGSKGDTGYTGSAGASGSFDQDLNTTDNATFNSLKTAKVVSAGGYPLDSNGEALNTNSNTQTNALVVSNYTAGIIPAIQVRGYGQNRPGTVSTATGGASGMLQESGRGNTSTTLRTINGDVLGAMLFGGYDGARWSSESGNNSVQFVATAVENHIGSSTSTTNAGGRWFIRSQPIGIQSTATSRHFDILTSWTAGSVNAPPTNSLLLGQADNTFATITSSDGLTSHWGHGATSILSINSKHQIVGVPFEDAAVFTGEISGTTLTVSAVTSGVISVGQRVYGTGITQGTFITALGTGAGGTGTYTVGISQTVSSMTMNSGADNTTLNSSNGIVFVSGRKNGVSGRRNSLKAGDTVGRLAFQGQTANSSTGNGGLTAQVIVRALEDFSGSARGSFIRMTTVNSGTTTEATRLELKNTENLHNSAIHTFNTADGTTQIAQFSSAENSYKSENHLFTDSLSTVRGEIRKDYTHFDADLFEIRNDTGTVVIAKFLPDEIRFGDSLDNELAFFSNDIAVIGGTVVELKGGTLTTPGGSEAPVDIFGDAGIAARLYGDKGDTLVAEFSTSTTTIHGNLVPGADSTYDLGASDNKWRSLYVTSSTIYIDDFAVSVAEGQLTIDGNPQIGPIGYTGSQGNIGYTGSQGEQGIQGEIGYTGSQGEIGYTGSAGSQGEQGIQGEIGYTGSQGIQGEIGYTGSQGEQGPGITLSSAADTASLSTSSGLLVSITDNEGKLAYYNTTLGDWRYIDGDTDVYNPSYNIDYMVVAGGGGAGQGGGGAGGYSTGTVSVLGGVEYTVTVGAGGTGNGGASYFPTNGSDSSIAGISTSTGGGYGGSDAYGTQTVGGNGGSGGGGNYSGSAAGGSGTSGQGNNGGSGYSADPYGSGGGGGANAAGASSSAGEGGAGGNGIEWFNETTYAGGGGGASFFSTAGAAGAGGGGAGVVGGGPAGNDGSANTGGGGGGNFSGEGTGAGGSGVVVIRYAGSQGSQTGGTVTSSGGYTYHTFTASGTFTS